MNKTQIDYLKTSIQSNLSVLREMGFIDQQTLKEIMDRLRPKPLKKRQGDKPQDIKTRFQGVKMGDTK